MTSGLYSVNTNFHPLNAVQSGGGGPTIIGGAFRLDCGAGNRIWRCGGGANLGRQSGGWETFWNLRAAKPLGPAPKGWGAASMNMVGFTTATPSSTGGEGWWFEAIPPMVRESNHFRRRSRSTRKHSIDRSIGKQL